MPIKTPWKKMKMALRGTPHSPSSRADDAGSPSCPPAQTAAVLSLFPPPFVPHLLLPWCLEIFKCG